VALRLYNTLTREKEIFAPLDPSHVRMYVCGPTVYDYAHVGNARPVIVFDALVRWLRRAYPKVTYVRNITDVEDKINARARELNIPIRELTERTAQIYFEDVRALGCIDPDIQPRVTDHMPQIVAMIAGLVALGHAYEAEGHVLFDVPSMKDYGRLSRRDRDDMIAGARVEVAPYKKDPADFVLWKPSDAETPGWDSPWGRGRPGWHIECSAMAKAHLGVTFDIHGGGLDLIFPHHENEIAQSVCANQAPFVRTWMHNGFVTVNGEKMSKSLGNFLTIRDALAQHPGEAIRLATLKSHYRQPFDWTDQAMREARANLDGWYRQLDGVAAGTLPDAFVEAMDDDLNTPRAFAVMQTLEPPALRACLDVLGFCQRDAAAWFQDGGPGGLDETTIEAEIERRKAAKQAKDFALADRIRAELAEQGVVLEDKPGGVTVWRRGA
jgi:cysteinyl-tRNA synthetase